MVRVYESTKDAGGLGSEKGWRVVSEEERSPVDETVRRLLCRDDPWNDPVRKSLCRSGPVQRPPYGTCLGVGTAPDDDEWSRGSFSRVLSTSTFPGLLLKERLRCTPTRCTPRARLR